MDDKLKKFLIDYSDKFLDILNQESSGERHGPATYYLDTDWQLVEILKLFYKLEEFMNENYGDRIYLKEK